MPLISQRPHGFFEDTKKFNEDEQYYLASKIQSEFFLHRFTEGVNAWQRDAQAVAKTYSGYKLYPDRPVTELKPDTKIFRKINWEKVVLKRHSSRNFGSKSITFTQLSNLLVMCCGLKNEKGWIKNLKQQNQWPKRALPSGGAMYSLEYYILARNVKGLKPGLYHFSPFKGGLALLKDDSKIFNLDFMAQRFLFQTPAAVIFVTCRFGKVRKKYGIRALRYVLMEAGGVGTQMNLIGNAMGLGFCFDGSGFENKIEEMIGIDGKNEGLIVNFVLGHSSKAVNP